jgi:hypothetical protein
MNLCTQSLRKKYVDEDRIFPRSRILACSDIRCLFPLVNNLEIESKFYTFNTVNLHFWNTNAHLWRNMNTLSPLSPMKIKKLWNGSPASSVGSFVCPSV